MEPVIETRELTKRFGEVVAVDDLDLRVPEGQVFGFLGLNGAGKTTTVRMLTGALPPTRGTARVHGQDVEDQPDRIAREVGVVFGENITPEPGFSPARYLRHFARLYDLESETANRRIEHLFSALDLETYAQRPIRDLSGGNKRKVEIARSLLHAPNVLFLDEPTRELDIPSKRETWRLFQRIVDQGDVTVFLSSHDVQEIATLCDRIAILRQGRRTWTGRPEALADDEAGLVQALGDRLEGKHTTFETA